MLQRHGTRRDDDVIDDLGVKVAAERLKLGRQQDSVRVIDLLGRITAPTPRSADRAMRIGNLIELPCPDIVPPLERQRTHCARRLHRRSVLSAEERLEILRSFLQSERVGSWGARGFAPSSAPCRGLRE